MKNIVLKQLDIKNFKGIHDISVAFNDGKTIIRGANASGKTTIFDALCWLLFDKNSVGDSKFEVRELDSDGNKVHYTDINVTGYFFIDGSGTIFSKTQKEKWVKKRGQQNQEYSGNINEYAINGYPKSQKVFDTFIANVIDETTFRILTSPMTFSAMDWKKQREIIFDIIGDVEVGEGVEYFDLLKPELAVATIDDIKKKYTKAKYDLKKKPDELQTRIDEVRSQLVEKDVAPLELEENTLMEEIRQADLQLLELNKQNNYEIDGKIAELRSHQKIIANGANDARNANIRTLQNDVESVNRNVHSLEFEVSSIEQHLKLKQDDLADLRKKLQEKIGAYNELKTAEFPSKKKICPTCGQVLPQEQIAELEKEWKHKHEESVAEMKQDGNAFAAKVKRTEASLDANSSELNHKRKELEIAQELLKEKQSELESAKNIPTVDGSQLPEYIEIENQITELAAKRIDTSAIEAEKNSLSDAIIDKKNRLTEINIEINTVNDNTKRLERIEQLEDELRETGQKISDCEQMLYAVESYVKAVSNEINKKFDGLEFRLFENQINGGMKETCQITLEGVPYSSLNSGHKIVIGLKIIETLRDYYKVQTPVWIDNAETINSFNLPDMAGQMILLRVTDDQTLTIN